MILTDCWELVYFVLLGLSVIRSYLSNTFKNLGSQDMGLYDLVLFDGFPGLLKHYEFCYTPDRCDMFRSEAVFIKLKRRFSL